MSCWKVTASNQQQHPAFKSFGRRARYRHHGGPLSVGHRLLGRVEFVVHLWQLVLQVSDLRLVLLPFNLHLKEPDKPQGLMRQLQINSHADAAPAQVRIGGQRSQWRPDRWPRIIYPYMTTQRRRRRGDKWCQTPHKSQHNYAENIWYLLLGRNVGRKQLLLYHSWTFAFLPLLLASPTSVQNFIKIHSELSELLYITDGLLHNLLEVKNKLKKK